MSTAFLSFAAIALYLAAAARTGFVLLRADHGGPPSRAPALGLGYAALMLHALTLYHGIVTGTGLNLSVFNAASLVAWVVALLLLVAALSRPIENLAIVLLPVAALAIALDQVFPGHRIVQGDRLAGLELHIALSIVAYSILTIAAIQALMLDFAERRLRDKRPALVLHFLPPLHTMEELLFQLISVGLFVLSLGLLSGFMFVEDLFAQHLVHKTVLSLIAWLIFAVLLWGRRYFGWRGRKAARYTVAGFVMLMLGFFGSNVVLELVLHRV